MTSNPAFWSLRTALPGESETTETLDAPFAGIHYIIPFGRIVSITLPGSAERAAPAAHVVLQDGREARLDLSGALGENNAGMLIFSGGHTRPEYVPWADVERIEFQMDAR